LIPCGFRSYSYLDIVKALFSAKSYRENPQRNLRVFALENKDAPGDELWGF
jgi:hypothetical protein